MKRQEYEWVKDAKSAWLSFRQMETFIEKEFRSLEEGQGVYVKDERGNQMIDATSLLVNSSLGHGCKRVKEAMIQQMDVLDNMSTFLAANSTTIRCSKKICELSGNHFFSVFFTNSGSEATDAAIKIIKKYFRNKKENRSKIISLKKAFHGSSLGAMALTQDCFEGEEELFPGGFYQVEAPDLPMEVSEEERQEECERCMQELLRLIGDGKDTAAVYLELVQLSNGVCVLPREYVRQVYHLCKEKGILFVVDEVATGFGRTGKMFASEHYGIWPDIMTIGKGMSGGNFPIAGVAVTEEIFQTFYELYNEDIKLEHGYTTGGHPVGCAAVLAVIEEMENSSLAERSSRLGDYLITSLKQQVEESGVGDIIDNIRGLGLMVSINFKAVRIASPGKNNRGRKIARVLFRMLMNRGILIYPDSDYNIIIAPPFIIGKEEIDKICTEIVGVLREVYEYADWGGDENCPDSR